MWIDYLASFFPKFFISFQPTPLPIHNKGKECIANLLLTYPWTLRGRNDSFWCLFKINHWLRIMSGKGKERAGLWLIATWKFLPHQTNQVGASTSQQSETPGGTNLLFPLDEFDVKPTLRERPSCRYHTLTLFVFAWNVPVAPAGCHPLVLLLWTFTTLNNCTG